MPKLYFEDLSVGLTWNAGPIAVSQADIIAFAQSFDPQPFHTDPEAAAAHRLFRGLAASGWHTAALSMRLFAGGETAPAGGIIGNGIDELRWPRPVRPDELSPSPARWWSFARRNPANPSAGPASATPPGTRTAKSCSRWSPPSPFPADRKAEPDVRRHRPGLHPRRP